MWGGLDVPTKMASEDSRKVGQLRHKAVGTSFPGGGRKASLRERTRMREEVGPEAAVYSSDSTLECEE